MNADRARGTKPRGAPGPAAFEPGLALFPLRVFLGITFVYAGIQKLSDPGFLHPGAPTYIGTQLNAFAHGTPGGFLLRAFALPHPKLAGVGVAFVEIVVGLLVLGGLLTRGAAAAGLVLNLVLFLTNSWNTSPYFLGSDIVFVFAWLPFVLTGASGQPAIDNSLERLGAVWRQRLGGKPEPRAAPGRRVPVATDPALTRRGLVARAVAATGVFALALTALSTVAKGSYTAGATRLGGRRPAGTPATTQAAAPPAANTTTGQTSARAGALPSGAVQIGSSTQLPRGQSATYRDPADGQADIIIRQSDGSLTAFSAVCTHQGCQVGYQGGGQIQCPCHGGLYNARTGAVEGGPPPTPLPKRNVLEHNGSIYALPA